MRSIAYALPILPGRVERGLRFLEDLIESRSDTYHRHSGEFGFRRVKIFRQRYPVEMVVVYLEADDVHRAAGRRAASQHEFEDWFGKEFEALTGIHPDHSPAAHRRVELVYDWHHQHGISRREHPE